MFNIKTAASAIAAVAVAAASAHQIITRAKNGQVVELDSTSLPAEPDSLFAFNMAQDVISERMLDGIYDDATDEDVKFDFTILYNTYLAAV